MMQAAGMDYHRYIRRKWLVLAMMAAAAASMCLVSLMCGSARLSLADVLRALFLGTDVQMRTIVMNVRLPRIAAAAAAGFALAISGCIMQNVLRNPLASPSTLGVSQGASFGAAAAIVCLGTGASYGSFLAVPAAAFIGGMATTAAILLISHLGTSTPSSMILAGVAISAMFSGATTLIQYFADDVAVATIVYWTFGSLGRAGWKEIATIAAVAISASAFFMLNRWNYNAIEGGTHTARSLGVDVDTLVPASLAVCALCSSVAVAFTGCISFIGLIAPHVMRKLVGNDFRFLIPCSALCGAALLLAADIACRMAIPPVVLPIGALTSFMGAPLFLYLIFRERGRR